MAPDVKYTVQFASGPAMGDGEDCNKCWQKLGGEAVPIVHVADFEEDLLVLIISDIQNALNSNDGKMLRTFSRTSFQTTVTSHKRTSP